MRRVALAALVALASGCTGAKTAVTGTLAEQPFVARSATCEHNRNDDSYHVLITEHADTRHVTQSKLLDAGDRVLVVSFLSSTSTIPVPSRDAVALGVCFFIEDPAAKTQPVCAARGSARVTERTASWVTVELDVHFSDGSTAAGTVRAAVH